MKVIVACSAVMLGALNASAAEPLIGMVEQPCSAPPTPTPALSALLVELFIEPGAITTVDLDRLAGNLDLAALNRANRERASGDWAAICRYRLANDAILATGQPPRVVLMGDSITENWVLADPDFFGDEIVGRGIGGQTTSQMLVRFRSDVVALRPQIVHILAGTNDIAGNTGPTSPLDFKSHIMSMVEIARANDIQVILGSIPPAAAFPWRPEVDPRPRIAELNAWLRGYADQTGLEYIDYYAALSGPAGELRSDLGNDGVHPNRDGYAIMRRMILPKL